MKGVIDMQFDLHIHSKHSFDCLMQPSNIVKAASKLGLSGIAVIDHNTIKGSLETSKINSDLLIIKGIEVGTEIGDIIGLFIEVDIKSKRPIEVIEDVRDNGGISILAHPFKNKVNCEVDPEVWKKADAIEVFNSRCRGHKFLTGPDGLRISANDLALNNAIKFGKNFTAGSDAHFYFEIGRALTIIDNVSGIEDVRKAILRNNVRIEGRLSSKYLDICNQLIKMWKTRKVSMLPYLMRRGFYTTTNL
jgi:predicted metal-dependent phosphoesterase TrpH